MFTFFFSSTGKITTTKVRFKIGTNKETRKKKGLRALKKVHLKNHRAQIKYNDQDE